LDIINAENSRAHNATEAKGNLVGVSIFSGSGLENQNHTGKTYTNRLVQNQNSYLNESSVKTATHKRRNISIDANDRAGLDTASQTITRPSKMS